LAARWPSNGRFGRCPEGPSSHRHDEGREGERPAGPPLLAGPARTCPSPVRVRISPGKSRRHVAAVLPLQGHDLALSGAGQKQQPDCGGQGLAFMPRERPARRRVSSRDRNCSRPRRRYRRMLTQGLLPSGRCPSVSASRMIANSMGIDRSAADGVDRSEANHCRTSPFVMAPIRRPQNRGRIWFFRYFRLTLRVPGFQVRECRRNAASAMSSNRESGEA